MIRRALPLLFALGWSAPVGAQPATATGSTSAVVDAGVRPRRVPFVARPRGPAAADAAVSSAPADTGPVDVAPPPPPDAGVAPAPPPPEPRRPKPRRAARRARPEPVEPADAGVATPEAPAEPKLAPPPAPTSGWTFWDVGPPAQTEEQPSAFDRIFERLDAALWPVLQVVLVVFLALRLLGWLVRRLAHRGRRTFVLLRRGWVFVEGTAWLLTGTWAIVELSARQSPSATLLALVGLAALVALSWSGLRDVAAGLMLAAERPFGLGDHVTLPEGEGRVRAFRSRVLELEAQDGLRVRVPYRRVLGATKVRRGGRRTTHAVQLDLDVPDAMEPQEALRAVRELAASSPWAVLGASPRLELSEGPGIARVRVVAFAFDAEAEALLYADLLSGWREARRALEARSPRG